MFVMFKPRVHQFLIYIYLGTRWTSWSQVHDIIIEDRMTNYSMKPTKRKAKYKIKGLQELSNTWVMMFGSMNRGNRSTWNNESDVNALAGVKSPPSSENIPKDTTVTITGILFNIKLFNCTSKKRKYVSTQQTHWLDKAHSHVAQKLIDVLISRIQDAITNIFVVAYLNRC